MNKNLKRPKQTYSVDQMMQNVASSLLRDFQDRYADISSYSSYQAILCSGKIAEIRQAVPAVTDDMDIAQYKAMYQIQSLSKRYRYQNDIYSDQELTDLAIASFMSTQDRLATIDLDTVSSKSKLVLDVAARYIANVVGVYSDEEHRSLCRFGKRASVGIPARNACEAARWELPISGSSAQIDWFDSEMSHVECVQEYWTTQLDSALDKRAIYQPTSALKLTLVPKSYKSLRVIMPNTTIGSYMSFGLGMMLRKRLKREGLDISTLQVRHRDLARQASVHGLYTTADLSSASDSITDALVKRLFPPDWYEIFNQCRIGTVVLPDNHEVASLTHCTMGIGYTFPLQTLVFLGLLKAIQAIYYDCKDRRLISVYGDDMIYASRMHEVVVQHFTEIGFVINLDKTFHEGNFRESCGGDYYRGVDVRPFQPRNGSAFVGPKSYEAVLYKYVNGLLARWSEYEIGRTLDYLMSEIISVTNAVKLVPRDFSDDAGVKVQSLTSLGFLKKWRVARPQHIGHGVFRFSYLRLVPDKREEERHEPYLWLALRGDDNVVYHHHCSRASAESPNVFSSCIKESCTIREVTSPLHWEDAKPIMLIRSFTGQRIRRKVTRMTISHTGRYMRRSGTSCFEDRRA